MQVAELQQHVRETAGWCNTAMEHADLRRQGEPAAHTVMRCKRICWLSVICAARLLLLRDLAVDIALPGRLEASRPDMMRGLSASVLAGRGKAEGSCAAGGVPLLGELGDCSSRLP